ncbi:hypothetical protein DFR50_107173 [Roseiarcus fermentans]|uniref:CdiI immunity protein domain-containing protein n=1 Tax=Roseiarcus fermentans TaxID=1473586 RepID=A0A366FMH1_9HYPH|nr:hypothetical protein [Roseiarcus fermentans]RBP15903.1 hypothetical protein DFR50_107173 [Roseiarcus fermentans]
MEMAAPSDFYYLGSCFIRDDAPWGWNNFPEWAKQAIALTHLPPDKIESLKAFLDRILSSPDDKYVDSMWNEMGVSTIHVSPGGNSGGITRQWFTTIRELLDTVQVKSLE